MQDVSCASRWFAYANQHNSGVCLLPLVANRRYKIIISLLAQASASCLPKANASHCEAILHAGFILRFTLVCIRKPTQERGMLPLRCRGKTINLSYPYSRSERFTFAKGKHFTLQSNASRRIYPALHVGLHRKPTQNTGGRNSS